MDVPETVSDAVRLLQAEGYGSELSLADHRVMCAACGTVHPPHAVRIHQRYRFEGPTDPADEAVVLAIECPSCSARGLIVSAYGPDADDSLVELVRAASDDTDR